MVKCSTWAKSTRYSGCAGRLRKLLSGPNFCHKYSQMVYGLFIRSVFNRKKETVSKKEYGVFWIAVQVYLWWHWYDSKLTLWWNLLDFCDVILSSVVDWMRDAILLDDIMFSSWWRTKHRDVTNSCAELRRGYTHPTWRTRNLHRIYFYYRKQTKFGAM